jgi:hypothetical protein
MDLSVKVKGLVLPNGLHIDEGEVAGSAVSIGRDPFSLSAGPGSLAVVRVSCASLQAFLVGLDLPNLSEIEVSAEGGLLKVSATARVIVPIAATALCALEVEDGKRVNVRLESAEPAASRPLIERQFAQINPVLDLSALPFGLTVTAIEVGEDGVTLRGDVG